MTILFFGHYNLGYNRTRVLMKGLSMHGAKIIECRSARRGLRGWYELFSQAWKHRNKYDILFVAFPGQELIFLARVITFLNILFGKRTPLVFDAFTSHYGGYVLDRQRVSPASLKARYYWWLDVWSCKLADAVLLDTDAHIRFFINEFGLQNVKFVRVFIGADSDIFYPAPEKVAGVRGYFSLLFHGYLGPLHGVEHIIRAAKLLENEKVMFSIVGGGEKYESSRRLAEILGVQNVHFYQSVPLERIAELLRQADVCLGVFGNSPKTGLVIPNKIYEAVACARPVITANTSAIREAFSDGRDIMLIPAANASALAAGILRLRDDAILRQIVAQGGFELFKNRFATVHAGRIVMGLINELLTYETR